jgi:hypothetical protein
MKYKLMLLILCCGIWAVQLQSKTARPLSTAKQGDSQWASLTLPPEHVTYEFLLRHIADLEALAEQKDQEGTYSMSIRNKVRDDFALSDAQVALLKSVASDCLARAQQLDEQAHQIMAQTRASLQKDKRSGQPVPKCPPALYALQAERNGIFLAAKLTLQQQFGDGAFAVFDYRVKEKYAKDIHKPLPHLNAHR